MKLWMRHFWPNLAIHLTAFGVGCAIVWATARQLPPVTALAMFITALIIALIFTWLDVRHHKRWAE